MYALVSCSGTEDENTVNGYEYVDLGLPSGTKWASRNVGAKNAESAGTFFAWGEVTESNYTEAECETYNRSASDLSKAGIVQNLRLTAEYDAATHNMGAGWSMPSERHFKELVENCSWTWQDKPAGYKVIAKNGNMIFLPATGYMESESNQNYPSQGFYWTSEMESNSTKNAIGFGFSSTNHETTSFYREIGRCVRAVTK